MLSSTTGHERTIAIAEVWNGRGENSVDVAGTQWDRNAILYWAVSWQNKQSGMCEISLGIHPVFDQRLCLRSVGS